MIYNGEKVEVKLKDMIIGRVSRQSIVNPITDETIVEGKRDHHPRDRRSIEELNLERSAFAAR